MHYSTALPGAAPREKFMRSAVNANIRRIDTCAVKNVPLVGVRHHRRLELSHLERVARVFVFCKTKTKTET